LGKGGPRKQGKKRQGAGKVGPEAGGCWKNVDGEGPKKPVKPPFRRPHGMEPECSVSKNVKGSG